MKSIVTLSFDGGEVVQTLPADEPAWSAAAARQWLDEQFVAHECEPLRASGKVLTIDKLLAVAAAIGLRGFEADETLRRAYAHAATGALARPLVRVDVPSSTVTY